MTRLLSGAALGVVFFFAVWYARTPVLLVLAAAVAAGAAVEYASLAGALGARVPAALVAVASGAAAAALGWTGASVAPVLMATTVGLGALALAQGRPSRETLLDVGAGVLAPVYIGLPLGALVLVHAALGREAAMLLLLTVVASDTAQYYTGRAAGRRPLAPAISPKKTVEGAAGGFVVGTLVLAVAGAWWLPGLHPALRTLLGGAVVVAGIAGDLFESLLKRAAGVKDSSGLIPGHGGLLDRIDALLFAAPVYALIVLTWGS